MTTPTRGEQTILSMLPPVPSEAFHFIPVSLGFTPSTLAERNAHEDALQTANERMVSYYLSVDEVRATLEPMLSAQATKLRALLTTKQRQLEEAMDADGLICIDRGDDKVPRYIRIKEKRNLPRTLNGKRLRDLMGRIDPEIIVSKLLGDAMD